MDSLRLEKAYRHFGHDIGDEDHVLEAGLGFAVRTDKPRSRYGDFIGRDAVLQRRSAGLSKCLVQVKLRDPAALLYHTEPILLDGRIAGYLTSGGYGHTLGAAIGLGYVPCTPGKPRESVLARRLEIEVAGIRILAEASLKPMYDPTSARVRA